MTPPSSILAVTHLMPPDSAEFAPEKDGLMLVSGGEEAVLEHPVTDPYWALAVEFSS